MNDRKFNCPDNYIMIRILITGYQIFLLISLTWNQKSLMNKNLFVIAIDCLVLNPNYFFKMSFRFNLIDTHNRT